MRGNKAIKTAIYIASAALFLSAPSTMVRAEKAGFTEQGIAGFAAILENTSAKEIENAYKASIEILSTKEKEIESPYANLGVSIADNYVNVRKEPSTESEVVGKLYRGCAADILEYLEGDWVKIKSGDVEGYIASNFLAIGESAEAMVDEYATKYATVNTQTLRVREDQSVDSSILTLIPIGETYVVLKEHDEWVEILLGTDENGGDFTGFVNKSYVDMTVEFKYAISVEEENRILREQEEAIRAEEERKRKLAQEEAERKEAQRRAEEAAAQAAKDKEKEQEKEEKEEPKQEVPVVSDSSSLSELRSDIVNYALKFVGNPYVWGGVSLTRGADCSGFVQSIYGDFGYRIPRVSGDQAANAGIKVSESDIRPGDLIFYANSGGRVNHVAMYIGNGKIVHAANSRQGIITSNYKYRNIYRIRRIVY